MALNIDARMMTVLQNSDCLKFFNCFIGVTRDQLDKLSMPRLTSKLKNLFNSNNIPAVERDSAVEKIVLELIRSAPEVEDEDEQFPLLPIKKEENVSDDEINNDVVGDQNVEPEAPQHSEQEQQQNNNTNQAEVEEDTQEQEQQNGQNANEQSCNLPFPLLPIKKEENISNDEMNDNNNDVNDQNMEPEVPQNSEQEQQQNSTNQVEAEEEDEIKVVAEVPGEVSVVRVRVKPEPADEIINLDESDGESNLASNNNVDEQDEAGSVLPKIVRGKAGKPKKDFKPKKVQKMIPLHPTQLKKLNNIDCAHVRLSVDLPPAPSSSSSSYKRKRSTTTTTTTTPTSSNNDDDNNSNLSASSSSSFSFAQWKTLYENIGQNIFAMDLVNWTWKPQDPQCHLNLFMILSKWCPNLGELNILANSQEMNINDAQDTGTVEFQTQKLKKLKLHHDDTINYDSVLKYIIVAAVALEEIEFVYLHGESLHRFLDVLTTLHDVHLDSLRKLTISRVDDDKVALTGAEVGKIASIKCLNLEELYLEFWLMDEAHVQFGQLLKNFSKLKRLNISGCFVTTEIPEPEITIDFPKLDHLEYLNLGDKYKFQAIVQTVNERPPKTKRRNVIRRESEQNRDESGGSNNNANRNNDDDEENSPDPSFFSVTLNLPSLPKLETLNLGNLYYIKDLHFSRYPELKEFRVSSPWHLSVRFPTLDRFKTYPKITKLQLPDSLRDYSFVKKIPEHFPNVSQCFISLPSVKVLRAFAKCMIGSKLRTLQLTTQFVFPSSLDACILNEPLTVNDQSEEEKEQIRILKEYEFWKEYVECYGFDVPDYLTTSGENENENNDEFIGLELLFKKSCRNLRIFHAPLTLRLPKGNYHFDDDQCEWTDTIIGFEMEKYPITQQAWKAAARDIEAMDFDLSATRAKLKTLHYPETLYEVGASPTTNFSKKMEMD